MPSVLGVEPGRECFPFQLNGFCFRIFLVILYFRQSVSSSMTKAIITISHSDSGRSYSSKCIKLKKTAFSMEPGLLSFVIRYTSCAAIKVDDYFCPGRIRVWIQSPLYSKHSIVRSSNCSASPTKESTAWRTCRKTASGEFFTL